MLNSNISIKMGVASKVINLNFQKYSINYSFSSNLLCNAVVALYWPRLYQNQKPKVEICSMALIFYNETNFMTKNSKMGKHKK